MKQVILKNSIKADLYSNKLCITCVPLTDDSLEIVCDYLKQNPHITSLSASLCQITDNGAKILAANTTLKVLDLNLNNITDIGAGYLATNTTLTTLTLHCNRITNAGAKLLRKNKALDTLKLLLGNDISITFEDLKSYVSHVHLILSNIPLTEDSLEIVCDFLKQNPHITSLCASECQITDNGAKILAANTTLKKVELNSNNITDIGAGYLATNTTITDLSFKYNQTTHEGAELLNNALAKAVELNKLHAHNSASLKPEAVELEQPQPDNSASLPLKNEVQCSKTDGRSLEPEFKQDQAPIALPHESPGIRYCDGAVPLAPLEKNNLSVSKDEIDPLSSNPFYQEFIGAISVLRKKMTQFANDPKLEEAYQAAKTLFEALEREGKDYYTKKPTQACYDSFKSHCKDHIKHARTVLNPHRGWTKILLNIFAIIITAGIGYAIAAGINIAVKGRFTFFSTDSAEKLNKIEDDLESESLYQLSTEDW